MVNWQLRVFCCSSPRAYSAVKTSISFEAPGKKNIENKKQLKKSSKCSRKGEFTFYGISFITYQSSLLSLEFVTSWSK